MPRHPLTIVGAWLVTLSAFVFIFGFLVDLLGLHHNPYFGLVFFLLIPIGFVLGLVLIPLGVVFERRRRKKGLAPRGWPRIDLSNPTHRRAAVLVLALTFANVVIVSLAAYRGIEYMDSAQFCGQVCHTVMQPEFVAHRDGPHSRVECVQCHVGSGAQSFVRSKLDGTRQLMGVIRNNYSRPIASPVHNQRPARDTCEQCHWPEKFHGEKVDTVPEYGDDEKSTDASTHLTLHVGGSVPHLGTGAGIHWHTNRQIEITYVAADADRQQIPYVRLKDRDGTVHEFRAPNTTDAQIAGRERRLMDCVDCHNRPAHAFSASAERAVDAAIAGGAVPVALPFARRETVAALKVKYPDATAAERGIRDHLSTFYRSTAGTDPKEVDRLVASAQFLYSRNVFPVMSVTWGTHLNNLGHTDAPGCFRCHDDEHKTADGRVIRQDCELCHVIQ